MSASLLTILPAQAAGRAWLTTFVDLILLLLTFFVLMFSMTQPEPKTYAPLARSYAEAFDITPPDEEAFARARSYVAEADRPAGALPYLETALKAAFAGSEALRGLQFRTTEHYIGVSLPGGMTAADTALVFDLAGVFANIDNRIAVIGLADQTADGWTAAIAQADAFAQALMQAGYDRPAATLARAEPGVAGGLEIIVMAERLSEAGARP
jgi:chemotaxis protein MotB